MLIVLNEKTPEEKKLKLMDDLKKISCNPFLSKDGKRIACTEVAPSVIEAFAAIDEVQEITRFNTPYRLASRQFQPDDSIIEVGQARIGDKNFFTIIAGPCAIESEEQMLETAEIVKRNGAKILRGGAFKPRTSPYSFQGLGKQGLEILKKAREKTGLPIVTEAMDEEQLEEVKNYADIIQIGARNMQNYSLLKKAGKTRKPILLKRSPSATIEELLLAAEYILLTGNQNVILCERGIKGFDSSTRNVLDLSAVALLKELTHLPVVVDPSHATGRKELVTPMTKAAVAAGADGVIIEVHCNPEQALCDKEQALSPADFANLIQETAEIAESMEKQL